MKKWVWVVAIVMMLSLAGGALAEKLTVGTNAEFPPFEFVGDDGKIQGFDIELIGAILKDLGYEYEVISLEFDALPAALESKQIDIAIAGMTISEEKGKFVLFSAPYFNASQKLMVKEDSPIALEADLKKEMKVGVQLGTTGDKYVTEKLPVECVRYNKILDAIMDMKNGRLDAVMVDAAPSAYFAKAVGGLKVLEENLSDEKYGIAVKKDNAALMDKINASLEKLTKDGTYETLHAKYFAAEAGK